MKKINSLRALNLSIMLLIFSIILVSCGEKPQTTPPANAKPVFTQLTASPTVVWYNEPATISGAATNATSFNVDSKGEFVGSSFAYPTGNLTSKTTFSVTATGPGGSTTNQTTIDAYSKDTTSICHFGAFKQISNIWYVLADSLIVSNWHTNPLDVNLYTYLPNGGGQINGGNILPNAWTITQASITIDGKLKKHLTLKGATWDIDKLDESGMTISQITKDLFNPTVYNKTIQKFGH